MNRILKMMLATALIALPATYLRADVDQMAPIPSCKELCKVVEEGPYVETSQRGIKLSGYVDAGYQYNFNSSQGANRSAYIESFGHKPFTDTRPRGDFDLNAVKLALEKPLTDANELQAGFRVDLMMGEDVHSIGKLNRGTLSDFSDDIFLEQAFVQFRVPWGNGLDFKVGKFVSLMGYEVMERPANLNISYGNLFTQAPHWHTGVMASYKFNDMVDAKFGVVNGWDTDNNLGGDPGFGMEDGYGLTASVNLTAPGGNANLQNSIYYGINSQDQFSQFLLDTDNGYVFVWDMWGNWVPKFANDKLLLGFNTVFGNATITTFQNGDETTWWGAALYAKYQFTDVFSLAGRFDYLHNDDSGKVGNDFNRQNVDIWSWTTTASFDIIENMMLRAEYRVDFGEDIEGFSNTDSHDGPSHQVTAEVVYSF